MTVYADVLIIVNTVIDFFILLSAQKLAKVECKTYRCILAAFLGGILSLYIFAPNYGVVINMLVWLLSSAIIVLSVCGKQQIKKYLKLTVSYIFSNAVYGGVVIAFWTLFKPKGMLIYNGVVYYQISPLILLTITVFCYLAITLSERIFKNKAPMAKRCKLILFYKEIQLELTAIIDTGHSLCDPFSEKSVIIIDEAVIENLLNITEQSKYRLIPYNDISGRGMLNAFVADKVQIFVDNKICTVIKPVVATAKQGMLPQDFSALISPQIFDEETECISI